MLSRMRSTNSNTQTDQQQQQQQHPQRVGVSNQDQIAALGECSVDQSPTQEKDTWNQDDYFTSQEVVDDPHRWDAEREFTIEFGWENDNLLEALSPGLAEAFDLTDNVNLGGMKLIIRAGRMDVWPEDAWQVFDVEVLSQDTLGFLVSGDGKITAGYDPNGDLRSTIRLIVTGSKGDRTDTATGGASATIGEGSSAGVSAGISMAATHDGPPDSILFELVCTSTAAGAFLACDITSASPDNLRHWADPRKIHTNLDKGDMPSSLPV